MIMLISASLTKTFKKTSVTFENIPLYPYTPIPLLKIARAFLTSPSRKAKLLHLSPLMARVTYKTNSQANLRFFVKPKFSDYNLLIKYLR